MMLEHHKAQGVSTDWPGIRTEVQTGLLTSLSHHHSDINKKASSIGLLLPEQQFVSSLKHAKIISMYEGNKSVAKIDPCHTSPSCTASWLWHPLFAVQKPIFKQPLTWLFRAGCFHTKSSQTLDNLVEQHSAYCGCSLETQAEEQGTREKTY